MKKISSWLSGIGSAITLSLVPLLAHAQAFSVATSTEQTNNGGYLTMAYNEIINLLTSTGFVLFMIIVSILGIVVWMAVKAPRHVVNS